MFRLNRNERSHWSGNGVHVESELVFMIGRNMHINHRAEGKRLFLFVREQSKDEFGRTLGFVNFGEVEYISHSGSQPMNIKWRLTTPMPPFMWKEAAKLAVG